MFRTIIFSKSDAQYNLIKKLKLFQQTERKSWKGIIVSATGQPGNFSMQKYKKRHGSIIA